MLKIIKRTGIGVLYLIILPFLLWISGWTWQPNNNNYWLLSLYWLTQSITSPWIIITNTILTIWLFWCLRYRIKSTLCLMFILSIMLFCGQEIKSAIKHWTKIPRPFFIWMYQLDPYNNKTDNLVSSNKHVNMLKQNKLYNKKQIPLWLKCYWEQEKDFSFPSGHAIFASSWALILMELLETRKYLFKVLYIFIWANAIIMSRLILGMHWPSDVIVGILISWMIVILTCWIIRFYVKILHF